MPNYNLTQTEVAILTSWLFEPGGYLDCAVAVDESAVLEQETFEQPLSLSEWQQVKMVGLGLRDMVAKHPDQEAVRTFLLDPSFNDSLAVATMVDLALSGITAREALDADPTLDITQWTRDNTTNEPDPPDHDNCWNGVAMVWWIRANDQVNIPQPNRPPESAIWAGILQKWDSTIQAGFDRASQADRNTKDVLLYAEDGSSSTFPSGSHLAQQKQIISKVLSVLT